MSSITHRLKNTFKTQDDNEPAEGFPDENALEIKKGGAIPFSSTQQDEVSTLGSETTELPWYKKLIYALELDNSDHDRSVRDSFLYNHDLRPVEQARRKWSWFNYVYFWIADCFNINTWQIASTGLQLGLKWWEAWLTVWIGYFFTGCFVVLGAKIGSNYHISFPVSARVSFGIFFSLWPVINRIVLSVIWYSCQTYLGMEPVSLMLQSIFGNDLPERIHNHINSPNTTTYQFMCFFIFWVCELPFIYIHPHQIRHLFTVKACLVPFAAFGFLIWALVKSHGEIALTSLNGVDHLSTKDHGWAFVRGVLNSIANFATLIVNAPDFSRFSVTSESAIWSQLFSIPFFFSVTSLIGIIVTSAAYKLYGVNYWSPVDVLQRFLDDGFTRGDRAGVFLISFVFCVAQLGTNISANSLSAGTDMTALLPRFISIRRGGYVCALLALCICPWNLMASSSKFTDALSAYAVFLSSIAGVICCDYYVVRRGYVDLLQLYTGDQKKSIYMYSNRFGLNWRALAAYLGGIVPNMPGFIGDVGNNIYVPQGAIYLYYLNYLVGYFVSFLLYLILCYFFPVPGSKLGDKNWYETFINVEYFEEERNQFLNDDAAQIDFYDAVDAGQQITPAIDPVSEKIKNFTIEK
ncbi:related to Uracil permease [Saccharomycodes ludwigii]|uniref:Related to Uracil permease n=1 Tax=Saccharomycodes ludwigii TaxID=36035 RepID=A0A376B912_9ASCO|nr:related to Uracil permease [Saccharomycodes ludwigii]